MDEGIARYLARRGLLEEWPLIAGDTAGIEQVVVIPCLAEMPGLWDTLDDLARSSAAVLAETLVICVVNNRSPGVAAADDIENNTETLAALAARRNGPLRLAVVDAASPGRELPPKEGVGLARKLGLDWGTAVLGRNGHPEGPLISADGDTRLDAGFLEVLRRFYRSPGRWGAVVDYAHPLAGTPADAAILSYEIFLRYHTLGLAFARSPYAYPTVGSTISCTTRAYVTAGGMNRRQAAEDFYFLQQLAKTGHIDGIHETCVYPAARPSHRVPFGTGRSMTAFDHDPGDAYQAYHPETYRVLRDWLAEVDAADDGPTLMLRAEGIDGRLADFLDQQGFPDAWRRIQANSPEAQRMRRFHEWFDAFRTLKLVHYLRDQGLPRQDLFAALSALLDLRHETTPVALGPEARHDLDAQRTLLTWLRRTAARP